MGVPARVANEHGTRASDHCGDRRAIVTKLNIGADRTVVGVELVETRGDDRWPSHSVLQGNISVQIIDSLHPK